MSGAVNHKAVCVATIRAAACGSARPPGWLQKSWWMLANPYTQNFTSHPALQPSAQRSGIAVFLVRHASHGAEGERRDEVEREEDRGDVPPVSPPMF